MLEVNAQTITKVTLVNGNTTTDITHLKIGSTYVFAKPFTYTAGSKTGVASITCTRASSPYAHASTGTVSSGMTIYYGDTIYFTATASTGYNVSSSATSSSPITVTGNVTGSSYITATRKTFDIFFEGTNVYFNNTSSTRYNTVAYYGDILEVSGSNFYIKKWDSPNTIRETITAQAVPQTGYTGIAVFPDPDSPVTSGSTQTCQASYSRIPYTITFSNTSYGTWSNGSGSPKTLTAYYGDKITRSGNTVTCYKWDATTTARWTNTLNANTNTAQYSYTATASGDNINSVTSTATFGATSSRTTNKYNVSVSKGTGIDRIYYKTSSSGSYSSTTSNLSLSLDYGTYFAWYATPSTGYNLTSSYTSSNPYTNNGITGALSFSATASLKTYTLTITVNTGVARVYYKVNGASSWSSTTSSKTVSINHGSNIYWYATASSGYRRDDNYTSSSSYATISSVSGNKTISPTATLSSIEYTICIAAITAGVIDPYYICSDESDYEGLVAPGGLGSYVVSEFQVYVTRDASLHTVWVSQSQINDELPPEYHYSGGSIECPCDPSNPVVYLGVYVEYIDDDH